MATPLEFRHETQSIWSYVSDLTNTKFYDLDPEFQREFVKTLEWKQNIIGHIMWTKQTGIIYFHPVRRGPDKRLVQESLDGKSRSGSILEFIRDGFRMPVPLPEVYNLQRLEGKLFSEWPQEDQDVFWNIQCQLAKSNRTMSREEVNQFFKNVKTASDATLGETLHSDTASPVMAMVKAYISAPDGEFRKFLDALWGNKKRYEQLEVIARCIHWQLHPNLRYNAHPTRLVEMWRTGADVTPAVVRVVCDNMIKVRTLTADIKVQRLQFAANFCPFFLLFAKRTDPTIIAAIAKALTPEPFKNVQNISGDSSSQYSRWLALMRLGGAPVDISLDLDN